MKINHLKADGGHYNGLTEWLNENVGQVDVDYKWIADGDNPIHLDSVKIFNPEKDLLATLRWS